MTIIKEFKSFALKGNVVDLAVAVIIGAAFGKIITSLVEDIINPVLGVFTGKVDFSDKVLLLRLPISEEAEVALRYGSFVTVVINFAIVAFSIFMIVKQINKLTKKEEAQKGSQPPKESEEVRVLKEIKEILANK